MAKYIRINNDIFQADSIKRVMSTNSEEGFALTVYYYDPSSYNDEGRRVYTYNTLDDLKKTLDFVEHQLNYD